tara:strand:- start:611 stop:787 length:177 start_codon:yes stop_codon:yes gene_type:complete
MAVFNPLYLVGITPSSVVKYPSTSAWAVGIASMTCNQNIWVHKDERKIAIEVLDSLDL